MGAVLNSYVEVIKITCITGRDSMKRKMITLILALTMGVSLAACSQQPADTSAGTEASAAAEEEPALKSSAHLLAEGYEVMEGLVLPVGLTNKDLGVETLEPKNAEKVTIDGAQGEGKLNLYVFRPKNLKSNKTTPVIYYMHGGGYQFGSSGLFEDSIQGVADGANATVISVDYTLTKDASYKYPMELEDAYAGLLYVYEHADDLKVDEENIIIEGDSAGGGLAARLALYNRDRGEVPVKGQILLYPMLDYRTGGKEDIYKNAYAGEFVWTGENNVSGWADLKAGQEKELTDEEMIYFSPAVATAKQLEGLPQAFIIVGSLDLFCDEDMDYAQKLMQAGVYAELHVEPGVPHAYDGLPGTAQTKRFNELIANAAKQMFEGEKKASSPEEAAFEGILKYFLEK